VHAELDKQVRARAASELAELDAQVAARADLQGLAQRVWGRLQAVQAGAGGQALALAPEAMSVSNPVLQGDALVIALNVWARPSWSVDAQAGGRALPAPAPRSSVPSELSLLLPLTRETLGQRFTAALGAEPNDEGYRVSELSLLGPGGAPGRWLWAARLSSESDSAWVYGESGLQSVDAGVSLSDVQIVEGAQALLAATGFGVEQLTQALSRPADLSADLEQRVGELRALLAGSVSPWPVSPLQGVTLSVQGVYAVRNGLVLSVLAR
jgi:hypothetical protein